MKSEYAVGEDLNPYAEMYRERMKEHFRLGIWGYIIGFVFCLVAMVAMYVENGGSGELFGTLFYVILSLYASFMVGFAFAGFPYGWRVISGALDRFTGGRIIVIDILIYIFLLILKFGVAILIGLVVYPVMLAYYFIRSRQTKHKVKLWAAIIIGIVVMVYAFLGFYAVVDAKTSVGETNKTVATVQVVDVNSFHGQSALVNQMCQNAMAATQERENENVNDFGWVVSENTQLHNIYFLEAVDFEQPHYINSRLSLSNAVAVVTGYYLVEAGPILENKWEMDIRIYPNFRFDEDQILTYDNDHVYDHSLRVEGMEELMEWFRGEYRDMNVVQMPNP